MVLPREVVEKKWTKNWSGAWKMTFASLYHLYTIALKPYIGKNFEVNLLICEKESSSNYIAREDIDTYGKYVADLIINNETVAMNLVQDTLETAEHVFSALEQVKNEDDLNKDNLLEIKKSFYAHAPPHFTLKKVIDFLPKQLQEKFSPMLVEARLKIEHLFNEVDETIRKFTDFIARENSYSEKLTNFLTIDEAIQYFEDKSLPSKELLEERRKGCILFCQGNNLSVFSGEKYQEVLNILINPDITELKGNPAFKGYAKGIARIIFDPHKVETFNEGDVLITGMTRPEFLPLMKKASAFVTDAGGMLSHAAIVARELAKPCILATESASKVIKEGDLVEVDANKGLVKILERAKE